MISASEFLKWLQVFGIKSGGGPGTVTPQDIQNSAYLYAAETSGSNDAYEASPDPAWTAYIPGQIIILTGAQNNLTDSPTLNVSGLGPLPIKNSSGDPICPYDFGFGNKSILVCTGSAFQYSNRNSIASLMPSLFTGTIYEVVNSGSVNAYSGNYSTLSGSNIGATLPGTTVHLTGAPTNTGASTFNLQGSGVYPIEQLNGDPIIPGMIQLDSITILMYSGANTWLLMNPYTPPVTPALTVNSSAPAGALDIDANGYVTEGNRPYFRATLGTLAPNVTGNGAVYTILFTNVTDNVGNCYNPLTGEFTAPVDGIYEFDYTVGLTQITSAMTSGDGVYSRTSTLQSKFALIANYFAISQSGALYISDTASYKLVAGETVKVNTMISGGPGNTVDVADVGGTYFSGYLVG